MNYFKFLIHSNLADQRHDRYKSWTMVEITNVN